MGCWNIHENLDLDIFWAGDGRFCGEFPPYGILAPGNQFAGFITEAAFFEAHLLS